MYKAHRERMRRQFAASGAAGFDDYKLIELILFSALPRIDTYPVSHRLLDRFKTLDGVFSASKEELIEVDGIGEKAADFIIAAGELITRTVLEKLTSAPLNYEIRSFPVMLWLMRNCSTDTSLVVALDRKNMYIDHRILQPGTALSDYTKSIEDLCALGAKNVIFAHRHPDSCLDPTPDDVRVTEDLAAFCRGLGVKLTDHYIVTGKDVAPIPYDKTVRRDPDGRK